MNTANIADQIARLTANNRTMTMAEEVRRMGRLSELHEQYAAAGGDEASLNARIDREVAAYERAERFGYDA